MLRKSRTTLLALIVAACSATSAATAGDPTSPVGRQVVHAAALPNVPGHTLTAVTVDLPPGVTVPSHKHEGFVFVYVLEGTVRSQLDDMEAVEYGIGETWVEPPGAIHTLTQNPSATDNARLLAVFVAKEGAKLTTSGKLDD